MSLITNGFGDSSGYNKIYFNKLIKVIAFKQIEKDKKYFNKKIKHIKFKIKRIKDEN